MYLFFCLFFFSFDSGSCTALSLTGAPCFREEIVYEQKHLTQESERQRKYGMIRPD